MAQVLTMAPPTMHQRGLYDCLGTCVANFLGIPYEDGPTIDPDGPHWLDVLTDYLMENGYGLVFQGSLGGVGEADLALFGEPKGDYISVWSIPSSKVGHAVIMRDGELVWDPNRNKPRREREVCRVWLFRP